MSGLRSLRIAVAVLLLAGAGAASAASASERESAPPGFRVAMQDLSARLAGDWHPTLPPSATPTAAPPVAARVVVVGFTGGLEPKGYPDSGVTAAMRRLGGMRGEGVVALVFGHSEWRRAAAEVLNLARAPADSPGRGRPPAVIACGHSLGAVAMGKFARLLGESGVEVSLAIYIDAFSAAQPRVPANVACAINFYQRAGVFHGLPLRGQASLAAAAPERTTLLGNYRLTPRDKPPKTRPRPSRRLLFERHYLLAHDARVLGFLCEAIRILLRLRAQEAPLQPASEPLR